MQVRANFTHTQAGMHLYLRQWGSVSNIGSAWFTTVNNRAGFTPVNRRARFTTITRQAIYSVDDDFDSFVSANGRKRFGSVSHGFDIRERWVFRLREKERDNGWVRQRKVLKSLVVPLPLVDTWHKRNSKCVNRNNTWILGYKCSCSINKMC